MDIAPLEVRLYRTDADACPFLDWRSSLDGTIRRAVDARLERLRRGLLGLCRSVGEGVFELKLALGPGYRIYFGREHRAIVILLHAGDKKRQSADIEKAHMYWKDHLRRSLE